MNETLFIDAKNLFPSYPEQVLFSGQFWRLRLIVVITRLSIAVGTLHGYSADPRLLMLSENLVANFVSSMSGRTERVDSVVINRRRFRWLTGLLLL